MNLLRVSECSTLSYPAARYHSSYYTISPLQTEERQDMKTVHSTSGAGSGEVAEQNANQSTSLVVEADVVVTSPRPSATTLATSAGTLVVAAASRSSQLETLGTATAASSQAADLARRASSRSVGNGVADGSKSKSADAPPTDSDSNSDSNSDSDDDDDDIPGKSLSDEARDLAAAKRGSDRRREVDDPDDCKVSPREFFDDLRDAGVDLNDIKFSDIVHPNEVFKGLRFFVEENREEPKLATWRGAASESETYCNISREA